MVRHYAEVWTSHHDKTCTLVREEFPHHHLAQFRCVHIRSVLYIKGYESEGEPLYENDFGEEVFVEYTRYESGKSVQPGVYHFAD